MITDTILEIQKADEKIRDEASNDKLSNITLTDVKDVFRKWLYLKDENLVDVVLGSVIANRTPSDPVWLFIVAPAGGSKTEIIRSLDAKEIYQVSSLSQHSLISGYAMKGKGNKDPSLLRLLNEKVLVIKDFTCILSMDRHARDEILGTLRDAYDGTAKKAFGSDAMVREYKAKFGILAGTTLEIDKIYSVSQSLGERFLKYRTPIEAREKIIKQAQANMGKEKEMRSELKDVVSQFLGSIKMKDLAPTPEIDEKFVHLAMLTALLRSDVSRNGYTRNVEFLPQAEVGTRLVKQLKGLAQGIALARGKDVITQAEYDLITRVAKDTLPSKRLSLIMALVGDKEHRRTSVIAEEVKLHTNSVREVLEDFWLLGIVERGGDENAGYTWRLKDELLDMIRKAEI